MYSRYERPSELAEAASREASAWIRRQLAWEDLMEDLAARAEPPARTAPPVLEHRVAPRPRSRWFRVLHAAMALSVLSAGVFVLSQRNATTTLTLDQTLERFHRQARAHAVNHERVRQASTGRLEPARGGRARARSAVEPVQDRSGFDAPAEGVYTYATTGGESVSMAGSRHDYPAQTYATVTATPGCRWGFDHRVVEEHRDRSSYCSDDLRVLLFGQTSTITFFGQRNQSAWHCDPPQVLGARALRRGDERTFTCHGEDGTSRDRIAYLGRARIVVGRTAVRALHLVREGSITGRAEGTARTELWLHPVTGLPLRMIRHVETHADEFGGVTYREDARFDLVALLPRS